MQYSSPSQPEFSPQPLVSGPDGWITWIRVGAVRAPTSERGERQAHHAKRKLEAQHHDVSSQAICQNRAAAWCFLIRHQLARSSSDLMVALASNCKACDGAVSIECARSAIHRGCRASWVSPLVRRDRVGLEPRRARSTIVGRVASAFSPANVRFSIVNPVRRSIRGSNRGFVDASVFQLSWNCRSLWHGIAGQSRRASISKNSPVSIAVNDDAVGVTDHCADMLSPRETSTSRSTTTTASPSSTPRATLWTAIADQIVAE